MPHTLQGIRPDRVGNSPSEMILLVFRPDVGQDVGAAISK